MKTTEIFVEQVLIGFLVLLAVTVPFVADATLSLGSGG